MRTIRQAWPVIATLAMAGGPAAGADAMLQAGRYRIEVTLDIPNVLRPMRYGTVERCVEPAAADGTFLVIVAAPPLADCPIVHRLVEAGRFTVEAVCPKANTGRVGATYELAEDGFNGRIEITAGGKNMRFTEVQQAVRVGECR